MHLNTTHIARGTLMRREETMKNSELLTVGQVANEWQCSPDTVRRLADGGRYQRSGLVAKVIVYLIDRTLKELRPSEKRRPNINNKVKPRLAAGKKRPARFADRCGPCRRNLMSATLITADQFSQSRSVSRVIFTIDRETGKITSTEPVVDTDEELAQLEPWIQACFILSELIRRPKQSQDRAAA